MNFIGQFVGMAAIAVSFFIYIQTKRYRMVLLKLITDFLWFAHHVSIFSYTAAATTVIAVFRELIFLRKDCKKHGGIIILVLSLIFVLSALLTWRDCFSLLPAATSVLSTLAFGSDRVKLIRAFSFASSVCMFVYGIHYFSIPTIINEILVESSIIISLIRERKIRE